MLDSDLEYTTWIDNVQKLNVAIIRFVRFENYSDDNHATIFSSFNECSDTSFFHTYISTLYNTQLATWFNMNQNNNDIQYNIIQRCSEDENTGMLHRTQFAWRPRCVILIIIMKINLNKNTYSYTYAVIVILCLGSKEKEKNRTHADACIY